MDEEKRKRVIREAEQRGREQLSRFVQEQCHTREEVLELTGEPECNVSWNSQAFCKWLAIEFEGKHYWPKFQFDTQGQTPDGFDLVNAVLSHKGHIGYNAFVFWMSKPIDRNRDRKTHFELLQEGEILRTAYQALYVFFEHGGS